MRRPEEHHRPLRRLLRRHGLRGQHQGTAHDPGAGGDGPAGGGPGGKTGDLCRAGRRGGPDRHLLFHALPEPPVRHPHRQRGGAQRGGEGDRRRGGGLLRRGLRPGAGQAGGGGDAHHPGRLPGAL